MGRSSFQSVFLDFAIVRFVSKVAYNVHSFAVGGAIVLRRPRRRVVNGDTKDKILFKSLIDKCQLEQKLNRTTGYDRRFASPPRCRKTACYLQAFFLRLSNFAIALSSPTRILSATLKYSVSPNFKYCKSYSFIILTTT